MPSKKAANSGRRAVLRGKPVLRIINILHDMMDGGYCSEVSSGGCVGFGVSSPS